MPRIAFVFRTDTHVADRSPASWKGDYPAEIWSNLEQVGKIAREVDATAVLDGGDYFHIKQASRNSHASIIKTAALHAAYPCPVYCLEGNHDLAYNDLDSVERQPLGVLYETKVFQHLKDVRFRDGTYQVRVVGVPYSPKRTLDELRAIKKTADDDLVIVVVHGLAAEEPPAKVEDFFGEPVFRYADLVTDDDGPDVWCFPPGTPVIDDLYRPTSIENIVEGASLFGVSGPTTVTAVHPARFVSEELIALDIEGVPRLVEGVTSEHPYWVARGMTCVLPSRSTRRCHPAKTKSSKPCSKCVSAPAVSASWVKAGEIQPGDYVAIPVPVVPANAVSETSRARLLGYYAAEGHLVKNRKGEPVAGVAWSFNTNETHLHQDVSRLVEELFGLKIHGYPTGPNCVQLHAFGQEVAEFCHSHAGRYAERKELSGWIWQQSRDARLEFLLGWLLGDGHARTAKTEVSGSTASRTLAVQIFFLALSLGLRPCLNIRKRPLPYHPQHVVSFYGSDGEVLSKRMGVDPPRRVKTRVSGFFRDGMYFARVKGVSRAAYEGVVHNFSTDSQTYVAGLSLVHNCFGHWHRDQGIVEIKGKKFVNQGALSRGALTHENIARTPQVAVVEFDDLRLSVRTVPLVVAPPEDVFDIERKEMVEAEHRSVEQFIELLQADTVYDSNQTIEENIRALDVASEVRDAALKYLTDAREG